MIVARGQASGCWAMRQGPGRRWLALGRRGFLETSFAGQEEIDSDLCDHRNPQGEREGFQLFMLDVRSAGAGAGVERLHGPLPGRSASRLNPTASRERGTCTSIWSPSKSALKA